LFDDVAVVVIQWRRIDSLVRSHSVKDGDSSVQEADLGIYVDVDTQKLQSGTGLERKARCGRNYLVR
jgi:hypothetical protein